MLTPEQGKLGRAMSAYSEKEWNEIWQENCAFRIWQYIDNGHDGTIDMELLSKVIEAAIRCGGWIVLDRGSIEKTKWRFVPIDEWLIEYKQWAESGCAW